MSKNSALAWSTDSTGTSSIDYYESIYFATRCSVVVAVKGTRDMRRLHNDGVWWARPGAAK